jgi:DNA-binding GntR family transcriptional regulator
MRRDEQQGPAVINTGGVPQPLAMSVSGRYDDHERIIDALRQRDHTRARNEMEAHIVGTVAVIQVGQPDSDG